jgi:hypothetical protein
MTVLCVGCSWTFGKSVETHETYPAHLQNYIDIPVINAGFPGTDVNHAVWTAYKLIDEYKPKIIVLQLSTFDRMTLCYNNGVNNFLDNEYYSNNEFYIYDNGEDQKYKVVYNVSAEYRYELITQAAFLEHKNDVITFLYKNVIFSDYRTLQVISYVDMFKAYAKSKGCEVAIFSWCKSLEIIHPLLDTTTSVLEVFGTEYVIDNGYHFSNDGNKRVAEEYVYPLIKDYV